jgi:hypothetical protein
MTSNTKKILEIDFSSIEELLYYDETSPSKLRWKVNRASNKIKAGQVAGSLSRSKRTGRKCWNVTINCRRYLVHRIVFVLMKGCIDVNEEVDHINGNSMDNTISNLRAVPQSVNQRNSPIRRDNTTGITGVQYNPSHNGRYIACYCDADGREICKSFSCNKFGKEEAFKLACDYRRKMIEIRNIQLGQHAGYTNRHGLAQRVV